MILKPSDLLKGSIIDWDNVWYIKYTDTLFVTYSPHGGNPFIVSDDPENTPRQRWNMSVLPSDRFFFDTEARSVPRIISLPTEITEHVAEELTNLSRHTLPSSEAFIHHAHYDIRKQRAKTNQEGAGPASPSEDEGKPGEA